MSIAIIIPAKNEEATLPDLLESLSAQTKTPDEVIVVNSHSTDSTAEVAMSFADRLPVTVHTAKARGVAAARNEGAATTSADYLIFIDADVSLPPHFVAQLEKDIPKRSLDIGGFRQVMDSRQFGLRFGAQLMNGYVRLMSPTPWPIFFSCFFIKRELFEEIGGFDPEIFIMEDYDLALRGRRQGGKFGIVKGTFFHASPRRYEAVDGGQSILNGFYAEMYRYTHSMRITKPLFEYKMGGPTATKKK